jgi:hypothetical protein
MQVTKIKLEFLTLKFCLTQLGIWCCRSFVFSPYPNKSATTDHNAVTAISKGEKRRNRYIMQKFSNLYNEVILTPTQRQTTSTPETE